MSYDVRFHALFCDLLDLRATARPPNHATSYLYISYICVRTRFPRLVLFSSRIQFHDRGGLSFSTDSGKTNAFK